MRSAVANWAGGAQKVDLPKVEDSVGPSPLPLRVLRQYAISFIAKEVDYARITMALQLTAPACHGPGW